MIKYEESESLLESVIIDDIPKVQVESEQLEQLEIPFRDVEIVSLQNDENKKSRMLDLCICNMMIIAVIITITVIIIFN